MDSLSEQHNKNRQLFLQVEKELEIELKSVRDENEYLCKELIARMIDPSTLNAAVELLKLLVLLPSLTNTSFSAVPEAAVVVPSVESTTPTKDDDDNDDDDDDDVVVR